MENTGAQNLDFDWLTDVYRKQQAINHPSELHGYMVGTLAGGHRFTESLWLDQVSTHMGVDELDLGIQPSLKSDLIDFYSLDVENIETDSALFNLFLPDDDYPLTDRLSALAAWVQGFLEGLAIAANKSLSQAGPELQELMRDLVEISHIDPLEQAAESAEKDFYEVTEYVRMGVLTLFAEFNQSVPTEPTTIH